MQLCPRLPAAVRSIPALPFPPLPQFPAIELKEMRPPRQAWALTAPEWREATSALHPQTAGLPPGSCQQSRRWAGGVGGRSRMCLKMFVLKRRHVCLVLGVHWSCEPTLGICAGGHSVVLVTPLTGPGVEISFPLRVPAAAAY